MKLFEDGDTMPQTDNEALQYLPNLPAAHGLYNSRRGQGDTIEQAMQYVLEIYLSISIEKE